MWVCSSVTGIRCDVGVAVFCKMVELILRGNLGVWGSVYAGGVA